MDFKDQLKQLGDRVARLKEQILTEEATKNAFIMPFIQCLGYDVFNPLEVTPEFIADIGIKKGEKVDYAIMQEGKPTILIECKHWSTDLNPHNSQLFRYFHCTSARFSILTNGIHYKFYTDLVEPNKMDEKPFFEFYIDDLKEIQTEKLKEFHKSYFDLDKILTTASELKYTNEIKNIISRDLNEPSDEFTRYFAKQVYPSSVTARILEQFKGLLKKSYHQFINDAINERLKSALNTQEQEAKEEVTIPDLTEEENKIITTEEELEAYHIVRSMLRQKISAGRIVFRDTQSYFGILLDDNNRKPLCRVHLNGKRKFLSLFDKDNEEKIEISGIDDIYNYEAQLWKTALKYDPAVNADSK
ncbi:type I restriction endonuclease [Chitinophaga rhizophila]|uniref:Type I restriction enzyme HsdR N-terminal domain-containing protein n=1 Tax=Chitinophaga rhizophila TaxID=2866212 RepID=A0ABS7GFQ2_9BACT|nr:type I restriction endonuclease [Chitinophaga rhizophila]MBW8685487.1 type I restriction enzyme HsdR N-terminal domain-containing protein [Chitinophaga rhizophila]